MYAYMCANVCVCKHVSMPQFPYIAAFNRPSLAHTIPYTQDRQHTQQRTHIYNEPDTHKTVCGHSKLPENCVAVIHHRAFCITIYT